MIAKKTPSLALCLGLVSLCFAAAPAAAQQVDVTRTSTEVFYIDTARGLTSAYASYVVENNTGAPITDLWVTIGNFQGGSVGLAANAADRRRVGALAAGDSVAVFFYLSATAATTVTQSHDITAYEGEPGAGGTVITGTPVAFTYEESTTGFIHDAVEETQQAAASKIDTVINGPTPPVLGGILTLTVNGTTGKLGGDRRLAFSPATSSDWPADKYELISSSITVTFPPAGGLPASVVNLTDSLVLASAARDENAPYTGIYRFRAIGTTTTSTTVSAVSIFRSGKLMKHDDISGFSAVLPIIPAENETRIAKTVAPSVLATGNQNVTYTITLFNNSPHDVQMDTVEDVLPTTPGVAVYVPGSTQFNGGAYADPVISGASNENLEWVGLFDVPSGTSRTLTYQATIPAAAGTYTNAARAVIGGEFVDVTPATGDNVPATADVVVGNTPAIIVSPTSGHQVSEDGTTLKSSFSVVLSTAPAGDVTVTVTSPDPGEVLLDDDDNLAVPAPRATFDLTFTAGDFDTPQVVYLFGAADGVDDGDQVTTVQVTAASAMDPVYDVIDPADVAVETLDGDQITVAFRDPASLVLENVGGGTHDVTVRLSVPGGGLLANDTEVVVGDAGGGTATKDVDYVALGATATVLFEAGVDGDGTEKTVTLTITDDGDTEGDETINLNLGFITQGDAQIGVPATHTVTIDDDENGVVVSASARTTTEAGGTDMFVVSLTADPSPNSVVFSVDTDDPSEGTIMPPLTTITLDGTNWDTGVQVTVVGVNDDVDDGDVMYQVVFGMVSGGTALDGTTPAAVDMSNSDDDTAGFTITPTFLSTDEDTPGPVASFDVVLTSEPTDDVVITVMSSDTNQGTVPVTDLTFTDGAGLTPWNVAQTVTITVIDDMNNDGNVNYQIELGPDNATTDLSYNGLDPDDVSVLNIDNEMGGALQFAAASYTVHEDQAQATITVERVGGSTGAATIEYLTMDDEGVAGADYTGIAATVLNFADGQTSANFTVDILDDDEREVSEAVTLILQNPNAGAGLGGRSVAVLVIEDEPGLEFHPSQPLALPAGEVGTAYSTPISLDDGGVNPSFTWTVTAGALPAGLSLVGNGRDIALQGIPQAVTNATFDITVSDDDQIGQTVTASFTLDINAATGGNTVTVVANPPEATVGVAYSYPLTASGGTPPYTWDLSVGALPAGLALNAYTGVIAGTPTTAGGPVNFTARATDSDGAGPNQGTAATSITVLANQVNITTYATPDGTEGASYELPITSRGGVGPFTWSLDAGTLPTGMSLDTLATGATTLLSGTPTGAGFFSFTVRVDDDGQAGVFDTQDYILLILPVGTSPLEITTPSLPQGVETTLYSFSLSASGGTPGYTWALVGGILPAGLTIDTDGRLLGTPAGGAAGSSTFTVQVQDAMGATATATFTLTVLPAIDLLTTTVPDAAQDTGYFAPLEAEFGLTPYTWRITGGTQVGLVYTGGGLPPGVSLSTTSGALSGVPTAAGTYMFTVEVEGASGSVDTGMFTMDVIDVVATGPVVLTSELPRGVTGRPYAFALVAAEGTPPYAWTPLTGMAPAGMNDVTADGLLAGTPAVAGTTALSFTVTDSATPTMGTDDSDVLDLVIIDALTITTPSPLPDGTQGVAYNQAFAATGGVGAYLWTLRSGDLPLGLLLDSDTGTLSGTPQALGTSTFVLRVTDEEGNQDQRQYQITIVAPSGGGGGGGGGGGPTTTSAPTPTNIGGLKPRGGGGCSLTPTGSSPSSSLWLLGLLLLTLVGRRRA